MLQIEVAHEALVRNWPKLETWLDEERQTLQARWDFRRQAERWERSGERSEWLARGTALETAAAWPNLSTLEQRYIRKGRRAQMLDRAFRIGGLAAIIGFTLLSAIILWRSEIVRGTRIGISRTAAQALIADDKELEERLGWALKAYVDQKTLEGRWEARTLQALRIIPPSPLAPEAATESAQPGDLTRLLETESVEGLGVEDALRSALRDAPVKLLHRGAGAQESSSSRGPSDVLLVGNAPPVDDLRGALANLGRSLTGKPPVAASLELTEPSKQVWQIVSSPDGRRLMTLSVLEASQPEGVSLPGESPLEMVLWNIDSVNPPQTLHPEVVKSPGEEVVRSVDEEEVRFPAKGRRIFNDDGSRIAGIGALGKVFVWETQEGTLLQTLEHGDSQVSRLWFGPSKSNLLSTATNDDVVHLWDLSDTNRGEIWALKSEVSPPQLAFSQDGQTMAAAVVPGELCLIDLAETLAAGKATCTSVALKAPGADDNISDLVACPGADCFYAAMKSGALQVCDRSGCRHPIGQNSTDLSTPFVVVPDEVLQVPGATLLRAIPRQRRRAAVRRSRGSR